MPRKPKLSPEEIRDLKARGFTQSDIARLADRTRQAISWMVNEYGGNELSDGQRLLKEHFPWDVVGPYWDAAPFKLLRWHGQFVATNGDGMTEASLKRLRSFYKKLRDTDTVVEYDPDIPPVAGVSSVGGWAYRNREPTDGELIIRMNDLAKRTDKTEIIWRFPAREP